MAMSGYSASVERHIWPRHSCTMDSEIWLRDNSWPHFGQVTGFFLSKCPWSVPLTGSNSASRKYSKSMLGAPAHPVVPKVEIVTGEKILQGIIRHLPILTADEKDFLGASLPLPRQIVLKGILVCWWTRFAP
jgi:hypothetical protein